MRGALIAAAALLLASCVSRATEESALRRGDLAFAQGDLDEAIAEYQLAVRQGSGDPETLVRVAHTYALLGRVDDAGSYYRQAVELDGELIDQAVSDLVWLARERHERGDDFAMAMAVETALRLRPGIGIGDLALPLARHYFTNGSFGRSLPFYQKALAEGGDSEPEIVFEVGQAYYQIDDCRHALVYFERYREMIRRYQRAEVDWHVGTCSFQLARDIREQTDLGEDLARSADPDGTLGSASTAGESAVQLEEALRLVDRTIEVGEPRSILPLAWFEKGEILSLMGDCDAAMTAYGQVPLVDPGSSLADRAQAAHDEIRFGQDTDRFLGGRCR